tara:strand:- start:41285 stop:41815 length:531 start_codon:yes stop_codon:yes gene_type:complete
VDVVYLSRATKTEKHFTLHPQGLVSRHSVTYLLATVNDYDDIRQFAMHRIETATISESTWRPLHNFDVDNYIAGGAFGYLQGKAPVTLVAQVAPQVAWLLSAPPLSEAQQLASLPDNTWQQLEAEVPDDQQTLWWLMAMGANVNVLAPTSWRETLKANAEQVLAPYQRTPIAPETY